MRDDYRSEKRLQRKPAYAKFDDTQDASVGLIYESDQESTGASEDDVEMEEDSLSEVSSVHDETDSENEDENNVTSERQKSATGAVK